MSAPTTDAEILEAYHRLNANASACAREWGVKPSTAQRLVRNALDLIGAEPKNRANNRTSAFTKMSDAEVLNELAVEGSVDALSQKHGISVAPIYARINRAKARLGVPAITDRAKADQINRIAELLFDKANIDPRALHASAIRSATLKSYGVSAKIVNPETGLEELKTEGLYSTTVKIDPRLDEPFPLIQPATPTTIKFATPPRILRKVRTVVVLSDAQIGFLQDLDSKAIEPIHDPAAMDVAKQITRDVQPSELVCIGDWMDWSAFSRWPQQPEMRAMTQLAIDQGYLELGEFISAAGKRCAKRIMIGSNHQIRPERMLKDMNLEATGLRRADSPSEWPVFSEPFMLRYDDLGITFSGQYPGEQYFLLEDLVLVHAPPKRLTYRASVLHGHCHRQTITTAVQHGFDGRHPYYTVDVGCMCRVDATTNPRRLMRTSVPSDRGLTDWTQGTAVVQILEGKLPRHQIDLIAINEGAAIYQGQVYAARETAEAAA